MEKFIVSARKYRPQNFSTVVGQSHITTTLKNAIRNNQLAHAFLFCGPRGVGKTTCARILAKTINCENLQPDNEACNTCPSCVSFNSGSSLNIHELDAASNNSVDDIRSLTEQVRFAPQAGKYKVYIIDEVHMLSAAAFNAFLKTLEEPPPYAIFILATTEKHKILPTILSRCQIFDFKRITTQDTVEHLQEICNKEHIKAERGALHVIAQKSEGCMRDALSLLDKISSFTNHELNYDNTLEHLNILDEEYFFKLLDLLQQEKMADVLLVLDNINSKGFEGEQVISGFTEFIRNVMVCREPKTAPLLETIETFREKYTDAAKKTSLSWLLSSLHILNEADINYKQAKNKKLHTELTFIRLSYLPQALIFAEENNAPQRKLDNFRSVNFRKIPIQGNKNTGQQPVANKTENPAKSPDTTAEKTDKVNHATVAPTSLQKNIEKIEADEKKSDAKLFVDTTVKSGGLNLNSIRNKIASQQKKNDEPLTLLPDRLQNAWNAFIQKLQDQSNPSAVTNFPNAVLRIMDEVNLDVVCETALQQKFIEQERGQLIEHLHTFFNNRKISYKLVLEIKEEDQNPKEKPLSSREQYLQLIEAYPLIKDLKDQLGLELDY
ncbi:MAG: DNA polymerase III subunit gamma/tau [Chitinophagaceae bacterium]